MSSLTATLWCDRSLNSHRHLTEQHHTDGFLSLPLTSLIFFFFSFCPQRTYYSDWNTLSPCSGSHVKQGSDWMMPGCRYSPFLKSIFPAAAGSLSPYFSQCASCSSMLSASVLLLSLTRMTSGTGFFCYWNGEISTTFYCILIIEAALKNCLDANHGCKS